MLSDEVKRPPTALRIKVRYADVETFVARFAVNVARNAIFIATRTPKPVGHDVRFEIRLTDDRPVLVGQGQVRAVVAPDPEHPRAQPGMTVELQRVSRETRDLIVRMLDVRRELGLTDTELPVRDFDSDAALPSRRGHPQSTLPDPRPPEVAAAPPDDDDDTQVRNVRSAPAKSRATAATRDPDHTRTRPRVTIPPVAAAIASDEAALLSDRSKPDTLVESPPLHDVPSPPADGRPAPPATGERTALPPHDLADVDELRDFVASLSLPAPPTAPAPPAARPRKDRPGLASLTAALATPNDPDLDGAIDLAAVIARARAVAGDGALDDDAPPSLRETAAIAARDASAGLAALFGDEPAPARLRPRSRVTPVPSSSELTVPGPTPSEPTTPPRSEILADAVDSTLDRPAWPSTATSGDAPLPDTSSAASLDASTGPSRLPPPPLGPPPRPSLAQLEVEPPAADDDDFDLVIDVATDD